MGVSTVSGSIEDTSDGVRNMRDAVRPPRPSTNNTTIIVRAGVKTDPPEDVAPSTALESLSEEARSNPHRHVMSRPGTRRSQTGHFQDWARSDISFLIGIFYGQLALQKQVHSETGEPSRMVLLIKEHLALPVGCSSGGG